MEQQKTKNTKYNDKKNTKTERKKNGDKLNHDNTKTKQLVTTHNDYY